jgi:tRNA 2-thiocytidine biosynthesis protein TtcA
MAKKWRSDAERASFFLTKKVDKAIRDHNMIEQGDRVLVGVSGGKDSMALLRLLAYRQRFAPAKYELVAAHVRGDARGSEIETPQSFLEWLEGEKVAFVVRDIILPEGEPLPMDCERCGRNRRRTLFEIADACGCNKVALGHHIEDFAHTALMNLFGHGRLETMAYRRDYFEGRFYLIRPLAYVREHELVRFAKACAFPIIQSDCPMAATSRRRTAMELVRRVSKEFRSANVNIVKAARAGEDDKPFGDEPL